MSDSSNEYATLLKNAAQGALNAYTTNLSFGGKPDQHEEDWIGALFCGMQAIGLVEELQQQLEQAEKVLKDAIRDIPKTCGYCKFFNWDTRNCVNAMQCSCCGGTSHLWRWIGESE